MKHHQTIDDGLQVTISVNVRIVDGLAPIMRRLGSS